MIEYAVLVLLTVIPSPFSEAAKKELKTLAGNWEYVKAHAKEGMIDIASMNAHILTIDGAKWEIRPKDSEEVRERAVIIALDPSTDPKILDLKTIPRNPKREGSVVEGIYKIDGDTLVLVTYVGRDKKRPADFDVPKETETFVWTLKRVKK